MIDSALPYRNSEDVGSLQEYLKDTASTNDEALLRAKNVLSKAIQTELTAKQQEYLLMQFCDSVYDRMADAIRDYHLMLGHYDELTVQCFLETAKRAQLTADAVKAREHAQEEMRSATYDLDDADAIKLLTGKGASA